MCREVDFSGAAARLPEQLPAAVPAVPWDDIHGRRLMVADEPTSQLDHQSAATVIELIQAASEDLGTTAIVVTNDPATGLAVGRTISIGDGRVWADGHGGEEYLAASRDGSVQLPAEVLDRGFLLSMLSMVGHPSWGEPLMLDVRQSGSGPW